MGRLQLFEGEQLFLRFRPHLLSFFPHYLGSLAWILAAAAGALASIVLQGTLLDEPGGAEALGVVATAVAGLGTALIRRQLSRRRPPPLVTKGKGKAAAAPPRPKGRSALFAWIVAAFALALVALLAASVLPNPVPGAWAFGLGAGAALVRLVLWETHRLQRVFYLTNTRLVARAGLGHRTEETLPLGEILEVRSRLGPMGQLFDYGDLTLVKGRTRGKDALEDLWILAGIGHLSRVKHQLEQTLAEAKLPNRERRRTVEERRVRESMRELADWMRNERAAGQG